MILMIKPSLSVSQQQFSTTVLQYKSGIAFELLWYAQYKSGIAFELLGMLGYAVHVRVNSQQDLLRVTF
jgi:hypothetical protein